MTHADTTACFKAKLLRPAVRGGDASWAFVVLSRSASEQLPRRGRTTVDGTINGQRFAPRSNRMAS